MKLMKKMITLAIAAVMVLAMSATVFAAETGTITITVPTEKQAPTGDTVYKVYKVFDATVNETDPTKVSYKLCSGDTLSAAMKEAGFSVDSAGNVSFDGTMVATGDASDDVIKAIAGYVTDADLVDTVTAAKGTASVTTKNLPFGYYYITTTTGTAVTIDTNNNNPTVKDKNTIPSVKKSAGTQYSDAAKQAIAAVGTSQPFTAVINAGKGAKNVKFTDTMTNMTYNGDVKVTVGETEVAAGDDTYKVTGDAGDSSFTITFADAYIASLDPNTEITLNYSATITSDALSTDPAKNTAELTSGDNNNSSKDEVEVYNAKFTVTKKDGDGNALAGAGFVIANSEGKYYKLADDKKSISWVDSIDQATEYTSDAQGAVPAFTGLGDGTYTLIEKTVPAGYNKAADSEFTIAGNNYTSANLEQKATVTNNSGSELPSTGGMGTTILYLLGGALVIGAAIALITRRRMSASK